MVETAGLRNRVHAGTWTIIAEYCYPVSVLNSLLVTAIIVAFFVSLDAISFFPLRWSPHVRFRLTPAT